MFGNIRKKTITSPLRRDLQKAVVNYQQADSKFNEVTDSNLIEAAVYERLAAQKRLDYCIRACRDEQLLRRLADY